MKLKHVLLAVAGAIVILLLWTNRAGQSVQTGLPAGQAAKGVGNSAQSDTSRKDAQRVPAKPARFASLAVFKPLEYLSVPKDSTEPESRRLFHAAMISYQRANYQFAGHLMPRATSLDTTDTEIALYAGVIAGLNREYQKAARVLSVAARQKAQPDRIAQINWYLAQAYLSTGEDSSAVALLMGLSNSSNVFAAEAGSLLSRINSLK